MELPILSNEQLKALVNMQRSADEVYESFIALVQQEAPHLAEHAKLTRATLRIQQAIFGSLAERLDR